MQHVAQFIIEHRLLAFRRGSGRGGRGDGCGDRSRGLGRRFRLGDGFAFLSEQIEGPGLIFQLLFLALADGLISRFGGGALGFGDHGRGHGLP